MAWEYKTSTDKIGGSSLYAYVGVNWSVGATKCSYDHMGGVTSPFGGWNNNPQATLYWREWDWGTSSWGVWHQYAQDSKHYSGPGDLPIVQTSDSFARFSYDREVQLDCDVYAVTDTGSGTGSALMAYIVPHLPGAPTGLTATKVSDNQIDLAWTNPSSSYDAFVLEVSIDGGSWSRCWYYSGAGYPTSYSYMASPDHSYSFRACTEYESAYSAYTSPTAAIIMKPLQPTSITYSAVSGTTVDFDVVNASPVATSMEYSVSTDGGETWGAEQTAQSLTYFQTSITGTGRVRVRNVNSAGTSAWLESGDITTICPPAPPTLRSPTDGTNINIADGSFKITWDFNSLDGSAQTAYELELTKNGTTVATHSGTTAKSLTINMTTTQAGDTLKIRCRTKGADPNWSDWSQAVTVTFYDPPTLVISSPSATVTGMPIALTATYSDMAGFTCNFASVRLMYNGREVYPNDPNKGTTASGDVAISGSSITASLTTDEFLPTNGESYTVVLTARSSSSLQTSANATFLVNFTEPSPGELNITNDPDTGYVSLTATFDAPETVSYSGNTNEEYASTEGYVQSLTVDGASEVVRGSNIATTAVYKQDYVIGGAGAESPATDYIITEAVPVEAGETYAGSYGHADPSSTDPLRVGIYTSAMVFISRPVINDSTHSITMPSNAAFVRFSYATAGSNALTDVMFSKGSTPAPYEPYFPPYIESIGSVAVGDGTITATIRSAGSVHDTLTAGAASWTVERKVGVRSYQPGDESDPDVLTDGTTTYYALTTPTTDPSVPMQAIVIGSTFTVATDLESTFSMTVAEGVATESISVSRVNADGTITPLLTDGASGSGIVDKYAPLNTPYQYAVTTTAASQAVKTVYVDNELVTDLWFAYWVHRDGDTVTEMTASAKWNPDNGGIQVTRPQKTRVYYAGRRDPVSYDGHAVALTETPSWMFIGKDEVDAFVKLIEDGGRGVYKSCDGWVYHADFDLTMTPSYTAIGYYGGASLGITRIAGEKL